MASSVGSAVRVTTGLLSADGGIDSGRVPTITGPNNPNGLKPNQLAFSNNCTVRDAGISPRPGWQYLATMPTVAAFQIGSLYEPPGEFPYLIFQIGGRTWRIRVDTDNSIDEITIPGDPNDPLIAQGWMVQGEMFLVIQDGVANPLFWDGETMRRSNGDSTVIGVTALLEANTAVGDQNFMSVNVVNPPGYIGAVNQLMLIGGFQYMEVEPANAVTFTNNDDPSIGLTIPAGTLIYNGAGAEIGTVLAETTIPAFAASQATFAAYTVPLPANVVINGFSYTVALSAPPWVPNTNLVRVINLNAPFPGNIAAGTALETVPELPPAEAMDYYMGRIWLAKGRQYIAGDIVQGPSGTAQYDYFDSILKNTENAYISGGGAFTVPTMAGNIRALKHPANLNTALGQGQLLPMTRRTIYSTNVVPERAAWAALSEPLQRVAQINFGTTSDRSCVTVNGDLFYQSVDGVRSLQQSIRQFDVQWGDVPLSNEERRVISRNDRSLLRFGTGIEFDNRLLQSALPYVTPVGVAHKVLMPLNFDLLNSMNNKLPPVWEGAWEGLNVLQLFKGDFGGRQRAFAAVWSDIHQAIEVWELTQDALEDTQLEGTDNRITWSFESPSYTWGDPFTLKQLDTMEIWIDRLRGKAEFTVEVRPDQHPCWYLWHRWTECSARNECEDMNPPVPCDHPQQLYLPQYRATMILPTPPTTCNTAGGDDALNNPRPLNIAYSFQVRVTIKGSVRVRGFLLHAMLRDKAPYEGIRC